MTNESAVQEVVAAEPKLFVGQVPIDCSEQALIDLMKQHATAQEPVSVTMPKRGNVPQSCKFAMVTFDKWQSAEAAIEALHGSTTLGSKPLVVRFADPPKAEDSKGIVPKKLFVGQIPKECSESQVRSWFETYGTIVSLVVKRNAVAANIAFVLFSKWKAAEEALAALHGTKPMESAVNPLVVKFADGKPKTSGSQGVGLKRGNDVDAAGLNKRANLGAGHMSGNSGMRGVGMGMQNGMMANAHAFAMMGMAPNMAGRLPMWGGQNSNGSSPDGMQSADMSQMGRIPGGMGMGNMGAGAGQDMSVNSMGMGGMQGMGGMTGSMGAMAGGMGGMTGSMGGIAGGMGAMAGGMGAMAGGMGAMAGGMGAMAGGMGAAGGAMGAMNGNMGGMGGMHMNEMNGMNGMFQEEAGLRSNMAGGAMGMESNMMAEKHPVASQMSQLNGGMGGPSASTARNCPWKLFVGQLPFTTGEDDLMGLFANFGEILECKVLRKSGSQESKGCGFVTFAAAENAAVAMNALNQQAAIPGYSRRLIVHYAK